MRIDVLSSLKSSPKLRIILSIGLASLVFFLLPASLHPEVRLLAAWDTGVIYFLTSLGFAIMGATPKRTLYLSRKLEPNSLAVLILVVITTLTSIFVIGYMLIDSKTTPQPILTIQIWLSLIAIICSWLLTHTMFALHYARAYYNEVDLFNPAQYVGGLEFPTDEPPDYLDFMYFAFTISMTSQTSDVSITSRPLRRLVLLQEIVAFFFSSVIVAVTVSTVADLV